MMPGVTVKEICDAIVAAYTEQSLEESLLFLLNERLDVITPPAPFGNRVFKLILWAEMHGRETELIRALGKDRPRHAMMQQILKKYGYAVTLSTQLAGAVVAMGPADAADGGLEAIVRPNLAVPDFGQWREKMTRVEGQVCRICINGNAQGTGFLVGPDAVLTNYHVMKPVIDGVPSSAVEVQFDFKLLKDGTSPYTPVKLAADWLIDHSPYSAAEAAGTPDAVAPTADELDYALIRLAEATGEKPWASSPDSSGMAPRRGWVRIPDAAPAIPDVMPVIIAQHPRGLPMKLALDTAGVDKGQGRWLNATNNRLRYATNTEGGSSGSPCFDFDWRLVALHHYGDPAYQHPKFNQGIPVAAIRERLTRVNKASALGGDSN